MTKFTIIFTISLFTLLNCAMFTSVSQSSQSSQSISNSMQSISTMFNSVSSISGSISSISNSSSKKNEENPKKSQYRRDVRDITYLYLKTGNVESLARELEVLGFRHGITDWRTEMMSYTGIGEGLRRAGKTPEDIATLSQSLPRHQFELLKNGYNN